MTIKYRFRFSSDLDALDERQQSNKLFINRVRAQRTQKKRMQQETGHNWAKKSADVLKFIHPSSLGVVGSTLNSIFVQAVSSGRQAAVGVWRIGITMCQNCDLLLCLNWKYLSVCPKAIFSIDYIPSCLDVHK